MVSVRRAAALLAGAVALAALVAAPGPAAAAARPGCGPASVPGGAWPSYGHDRANSRYQDSEKLISPADAPLLSPVWALSTTEAGGEGDVTGTPIVAGGCMYVATNRGWVFAANADTGELAWKSQVPYGGGISSSLAVRGGLVYATVSRLEPGEGCPGDDPCIGPYMVAFERDSGRVAWATPPLDGQPGSDIFASPVVFRGVVMTGVSGGAAELADETERYAFQGSMVFVSADDGRLLEKTWTIHPPHEPNDRFAGAGIWSTPAIDRRARVAYVGTANPFQPQAEHAHANAVLKLDVDPASPTFGEILDSYKGLVDEYVPALSKLPCYDFPGNTPPYYPQGIGSCGDIDLDFGAAPNLFHDARGRLLVGSGQKSGVYHVFDAETMRPVWTSLVGPPGALGGIVGSTAYDGRAIYGPVTIPGYIWSISPVAGTPRWVGPTADGLHYGPPVAVANGVVYTVGLTGFLDAFDARFGGQLAKRPLILGGGGPLPLSWGGVSIARNTIYAGVGIRGLPEGFVIALRPGAPTDVVGDAERTVADLLGGGGGGEAPGGATIVAGPGAAQTTYATPVMVTRVGGPLSFTNLDIAQHDVTAALAGPDGRPLFRTPLIGLGETTPVEGLDQVRAGQSYGFYCSIHPGMRGTLVVR